MMVLQHLILIFLLPGFLWSNNDLNNIKTRYAAYDNGTHHEEEHSLIGLQIEQLLKNNDYVKAKILLKKLLTDDKAPKQVAHYLLSKIAIAEKKYRDFEKSFLEANILSYKNLSLVKDVYEILPKKEKSWLFKELIKSRFFERQPESSCPYFELNERKARALFLYQMLVDHNVSAPLRKDLLFELYVLKPEAVPHTTLKKLAYFKSFFRGLTIADIGLRMENLLIFGKNQEARDTFVDAQVLKKNEPLCELIYILAKVDRKMRKYDIARKRFSEVAAICPEQWQIKARYMDLMLASTLSDEASLPLFDAFVKDYPRHSFTDDVLMFKASLLLDKTKVLEALPVLEQIISQFPDGDMISRALFLQAFNLAKLGQHDKALLALKELKRISEAGSLEYQQAEYWSARLALSKDPKFLKATRMNAQVKKQLVDLAESASPTVYSWFAHSLLKEAKQPLNRTKAKIIEQALVLPTHQDVRLKEIEKAISFGFRNEALLLLEGLAISHQDIDGAMLMANFYDVLNRPQAGHQKLVRCNYRVGLSLAKKIPHIYQRISYPNAYADEIRAIKDKVSMPKEIIYGIMRQESGFIAEACSWAGAKGLMQLMYVSALEQAKPVGLANLKEEELYIPHTNILLGSSLFMKYWKKFSSFPLALMAYNAGPGPVNSWSKKMPDLPLDTFIESIPYKETRDYVKKVLGSVLVYKNQEESSLSLDLVAATKAQ